MAFMIRFVSASALRYFNATGGPTRICTVGGFVTLRMFGSRAERGHTFSVPHSPMGMTGASVAAARRAAPNGPSARDRRTPRPAGSCPRA